MSSPAHKLKTIYHIVPRIEFGGTERIVTQTILSERIASEWRHVLYVMKDDQGENFNNLKEAGCDIRFLHFKKGGLGAFFTIIKSVFRLRRDCKREHPDIVMGWLYYGNILASLIAPKSVSVLHNIRNSAFDVSRYKISTRLALSLNAKLSHNVAMTIYNSFMGRNDHQNNGFCKTHHTVIHNGINTELFKPSESHRKSWREKNGFSENEIVVLTVGRNDAQKRYDRVLALAKEFPNITFVALGEGVENLKGSVNFKPLAHQTDIHTVYPGADIILSTSEYGEGFQNTVAEGMASGLIPICHKAGDIEILIGNAGYVAEDYGSLGKMLDKIINLPHKEWTKMQQNSRKQIADNFSIGRFDEALLKCLDDINLPFKGSL